MIQLHHDPTYLRRFFPRSERGNELLALGWYFSFYFADGHLLAKRTQVVDVCRSYWSRFGSRLRWMIEPIRCNWRAVQGSTDLERWAAGFPNQDWGWSMSFHSGQERGSAGEYGMLGIGKSTEVHAYSSLWLTVGLDGLGPDRPLNPVDLYLEWAETLKPHYGTAGFGLIPPEDTPRRGATKGVAASFRRQFPGVELVDDIGNKNAIGGLLSANWLNLIDDECLATLGGMDGIGRRLRELHDGTSVGLERYAGGVLLQSGNTPLLNEPGRPATVPRAYQPVARLLKPLRTPDPWGCWGCPKDESLAWLARFD